MSVRPLLLPDTASQAGYDHLDPISQWFLGGSGTAGAEATGISDDDRYGLDLQNAGQGGNSLRATSGDNTYQLRVNNSGITLIGGVGVTGAAVFSSTLTVTGSVTAIGTVTGAQLVSTAGAGTSPLVVSSTTVVSNLNADLLDGSHASAFSASGHNHDNDYVDEAGDTMSGMLTIEMSGGGNDQALKLKHNATAGAFYLGGSNATSPDLIFKDNSSTEIFRVGHSSATYQATVTGDLRVTDDAYVAGDLSGSRVFAGATAAAGAEELRVVGQSRFEGSVTVTGAGISVAGGSSTFDDAVSITNNGLTVAEGISVTSGGIGVTGSSLFSGVLTLQSTVTLQVGALIDFDAGSSSGFTNATGVWSGYVTAKHDTATIYIPYLSSAP